MDPINLPGNWKHRTVYANGINFHAVSNKAVCVDSLKPNTPVVIFMPGFLEYWWSWHEQLLALGEHDIPAVAVDLRGTGGTDKPPRGYDGRTFASDMRAITQALGHSHLIVCGRNLTTITAWSAAILYPKSVAGLISTGGVHVESMHSAVKLNRKSRYFLAKNFLLYQIPKLPEYLLLKNQSDIWRKFLLRYSCSNWHHTRMFEDTARNFQNALQIPKVAFSNLEIARWFFRSRLRPDGYRFHQQLKQKTGVPVLEIFGEKDKLCPANLMGLSRKWTDGYESCLIRDAGHYMQLEQPDQVNHAIIGFYNKVTNSIGDQNAKS